LRREDVVRAQIGLTIAVLLTGPSLAAEPPADNAFAIEVILPQASPKDRTIALRCEQGCSWYEKSFHCPAGKNECRAVVASDGVDPGEAGRQAEAKPLPGGGICVGVHVITNPPGTMVKQCEDEGTGCTPRCCMQEVPATDSRAYVNHVLPGSPAEDAGMKPGDVVMSFNDAPIRGSMDVRKAMRGRPGDPFRVMLERDGTSVVVQERYGLQMSDGTCAGFSPVLLQAAMRTDPDRKPPNFLLAMDVPPGPIQLRCLEGCWGAGSSGYTECQEANGCTFVFEQSNNGFREGSEGMGREPAKDPTAITTDLPRPDP
jgi:hypothetical protein